MYYKYKNLLFGPWLMTTMENVSLLSYDQHQHVSVTGPDAVSVAKLAL